MQKIILPVTLSPQISMSSKAWRDASNLLCIFHTTRYFIYSLKYTDLMLYMFSSVWKKSEDHTIGVEYHHHQYSYHKHLPCYHKQVSAISHTGLGVVTVRKIDMQTSVGGEFINTKTSCIYSSIKNKNIFSIILRLLAPPK